MLQPLSLVAPLLFFLFPGDWNTVGGNAARDGSSDECGPTAPTLSWQGGVSAQVSQQPLVEGDYVVTARIFNLANTTGGTDIVSQDLGTGAIHWQGQLPVSFPDAWRSRLSGLRDGQVYATRSGNTNAEYLYALDVATGAQVWRSDALITESSTEGVSYAPNGDPISYGVNSVVRIDKVTGGTVWETPRSCPSSGGCDSAVFGDRVYVWEASAQGPKVTAFDLSSGARLYSSPGIGGGFVQQLGLFVGPDGTVYAPRSQSNVLSDFFVSMTDTGGGFVENWRVPMGFVPFASHGVGPDGSVYSYDASNRVVRLDPANGNVLDTSAALPINFPMAPRMAIDAAGRVYLTNGGFSQGRVFCFEPDLAPVWSEAVVNVNVGGPALGEGGVLVVCGTGTDVRAYAPTPSAAYCTAGTSASGCTALLTGTGTPSASAPSGFVISAASVEGSKDGQFYFGVNGRQAVSWGNGTSYRCVVPPTSRAGLLTGSGTNGACDGGFSQDLNTRWVVTKPGTNPGAGSTVQLQLWYRDPGSTSDRTTSFSDALELTVCP
jgi:outer membrane protein assembly factor BamB